ncbi:pilus assembly protein [Litoribrevibacter euphylliae]|uniref:Pilus assembly protein n=1 Tax=Litoribrevibacter euphylliae TaxID=1834034 RepID=A0ABV7H9B0_9GAMM
MFKRLISFTSVLALSWGCYSADTDIFEPNPLASSENPNILILLDNSANWSAESGGTTKKVLIHEALYKVIMSADNNTMNLGLGIFADTGSGGGGGGANVEGSKLANRIQNLDASLKDTYAHLLYNNADDLSLIEVTDGSGEVIGYLIDGFVADQEALEKANNAPYAMSMNEARLYFGGMTPESSKTDPWDKFSLGSDQAGDYESPITLANACGANYIILLANGAPDSGENNKAEARLKAHGADATQISLTADKFEANWVDEYARYMSTADMNDDVGGDQPVITYVVDIYDESTLKGNNKPGSNNFEGARALLKSVASQGKGKYFTASDSDEVVVALQSILDDILDKSSVFAASALPVSVNTRGTNLNQVYMGVFQPDKDRQPRWYGNLKLYQIGNNNGSLALVDQNDIAVRDASRGFVNSNVQSFWTHDSTFFDYAPRGTGIFSTGSDSPDGEVVEKGGAAQQIREGYTSTSNTGRTLYTCVSCSSTLQTFNSSTSGLSTTLVEWIYGANNTDDGDSSTLTTLEQNNDDEGTAAVRASVHGDVVHSQPTIINYGNGDIYVFYGSNDGIFRAVKGGLTGSGVGEEVWGFIPPEHFSELEDLRTNAESSLFGSPNKPWFIDGDISSYYEDTDGDGIIESGDKAYLYLTMRRGGNFIYALDVSNPTSPKFLFKITGGSGSFSELADTWSGIEVTKILANSNPVLVFGGGYDESADDVGPDTLSGSTSAGTATTGRAIFVVDAFNGNLIASIGPSVSHTVTVPDMDYSIPANIAVLDINNNGYADRFYAADTGANIWRVDTEVNPTPSNWTVTHIADVSNNFDGNSSNDGRKFLYRVDVVAAEDSVGDYHAVLIGSGDREHPFDTGVKNYMYMFKDRYINLLSSQSNVITMPSMYDATDNLIQEGSDPTAEIALLDSATGWFIELGTGEKTVSHVTSLAGVAYFNTNQPDTGSTSCGSNLGIARIYQISVTNATAVTENDQIAGLTLDDRSYEVPGGGYPPPPVHVIVEVDGELVEAIISGTEVNESQSDLNTRTRTFWSKQIDN